MAKFNKSEIMRNAHRTYKYVGKKKGQSFSEVLKATWKLARLQAQMDESAAKAKQEAEKKSAEWAEYMKNRKVERADYNGYISHEAIYGRSFSNGGYVGD